MAEEADCLDFYNYVYQPFSAAIHSTWPHVSDKNTQYCSNPAHRYHRKPLSMDLEPDAFWLFLGAKYLEKTLKKFDEETGVQVSLTSAYEQLHQDFESFSETKSDEPR
jgi:hypothetical protein